MTWTPVRDALRGRVAVVAGATRGAGRGIAAALGEAGATVVCTGRSSMHGRGGSDYDRPETIEETAELVDAARRRRHPDPGRPSRPRPGAGAGRADPARARRTSTSWSTTSGAPSCSRAAPPTGTRPIWGHDLDKGLRILRLGRRDAPDHVAPSAAAADRRAGRAARRDDRRHGRHTTRRATGSRSSTTWRRPR